MRIERISALLVTAVLMLPAACFTPEDYPGSREQRHNEGGSTSTGSSGLADGGCDACLVDRGLLVRYYLDETLTQPDQGPTKLNDAALQPLPLPLFLEVPQGENAGLTEEKVDAHRGVWWSKAGMKTMAQAAIGLTKVQDRLDESQVATIELVVAVDDVMSSGSRLFDIGSGRLSVRSSSTNRVELHWHACDGSSCGPERQIGLWTVALGDLGRVVLHIVLDVSNSVERVRLHVNGAPVTTNEATVLPEPGSTIGLREVDEMILGNRPNADSSFAGTMYYAAVYSAALDSEEVNRNAASLLMDDDSP